SSIAADDIPLKLRCTKCSKLTVNAVRLVCCGQSICGQCHTTLTAGGSCPLCQHTPLNPEDCAPHKALRTTVKAFLRSEEKKQGKGRRTSSTVPATPTTPA
ncbi:hypothetical protein K402DRAFT_299648, partial [Aulographum hederae CBS 113979]